MQFTVKSAYHVPMVGQEQHHRGAQIAAHVQEFRTRATEMLAGFSKEFETREPHPDCQQYLYANGFTAYPYPALAIRTPAAFGAGAAVLGGLNSVGMTIHAASPNCHSDDLITVLTQGSFTYGASMTESGLIELQEVHAIHSILRRGASLVLKKTVRIDTDSYGLPVDVRYGNRLGIAARIKDQENPFELEEWGTASTDVLDFFRKILEESAEKSYAVESDKPFVEDLMPDVEWRATHRSP